jgi:succinate-semialdehyde dehydrogenase/glutarate-semialdehyde dehydrogenase
MSAFDRSKIMRKAANLLRERADAIAPLMTQEQGKTLVEAKGEILAGADTIDWFAEEARPRYGRVIPSRTEGVYQLVIKEPVGPVAAFSPWNFPINQAVRRYRPRLAAGCSIIIKAPEENAGVAIRADSSVRLRPACPPVVGQTVFGVPSEISGIPDPASR